MSRTTPGTGQPLRLVVHDFGGYAFTAQLSRVLAARGHHVLYLSSQGFRPQRDTLPSPATSPRFVHERVRIGRIARSSLSPSRLIDEYRYGRLLARRIAEFRPDVVLSANCPLDAQAAALASTEASGAKFIFWLQDVYSEAVGSILRRRLGWLGSLVGARFARLERRLLRNSDMVVAITEDFVPYLERWGVGPSRIAVIGNWAPLDEVSPRERRNAWSITHHLAETPVLLYTGTLGRKHDPSILVTLAEALPDARVVVVSAGAGTDWLTRHGAGLPNLVLLPYQAARDLPDVLASADVLVALLEEDAGIFSVPSKVLTYLAAGRPILAVMPRANLAAKIVEAAGAGRVVAPSDRSGLLRAAAELIRDDSERTRSGTAGWQYAARTFDIDRIADAFEDAITRAGERVTDRVAAASDTA